MEIEGPFDDLGGPFCSLDGPPHEHRRPLADENGEVIDQRDPSRRHATTPVEVIGTLDDAEEVLHETTKTDHRSLVALKLPTRVQALITYATGIVTALTGNPDSPTIIPTLATLTAAIAALQTAETAALARAKGAVITRNEKRLALVQLLQQLKGSDPGGGGCQPRERRLDHRERGSR